MSTTTTDVLPRAGTTDDSRWTTDPRPDLAADSSAWARLLSLAWDADGLDETGCHGVLHGLRCCGAGLERSPSGGWRIVPGEMGEAEYKAERHTWLLPLASRVSELLHRLNTEERKRKAP